LLQRAAGDAAADGPKAHQCDFDRQPCLLPGLEICKFPGGEPYSPPISAETSESQPAQGVQKVQKTTWPGASKKTQPIGIRYKNRQGRTGAGRGWAADLPGSLLNSIPNIANGHDARPHPGRT